MCIANPTNNQNEPQTASQAQKSTQSKPNYGTRPDGSQKGSGYFGELEMKDGSGRVATEVTTQFDVDGRSLEVPLLVPTLTEEEKDYVLTHMEGTKTINDKAIRHALEREAQGLSPYKE